MKKIGKAVVLALNFLLVFAVVLPVSAKSAAGIFPVEELVARDMPYDAGGYVLLEWKAMHYDGPGVEYKINVSASEKGPWIEALKFPSDKRFASDIKLPYWAWKKSKNKHAVNVDLAKYFPTKTDEEKKALRKNPYYFQVISVKGRKTAKSPVLSAVGKGNWFSLPRLNNLLYALIFGLIVLWFISHAKRKELFLRRIPGLDAVDEAIGRATEMGKPIYFMTGRMDMDSISTIAAVNILGEVAKKVATYDAQLKVPHTYPIPMAVCQEITKQAYTEAGRPDAYREDINFFVTDDQFAYTAAVDGMMTREKPAAIFYMGYYYAESLLLTEVGAATGAIQIAGTDAEHQLPFFFMTCDYTLIGEELYAAGAYLSKDPVLVGTLRGQDIGKAFMMAVVLMGILGSTLGLLFGWENFSMVIMEPFHSF